MKGWEEEVTEFGKMRDEAMKWRILKSLYPAWTDDELEMFLKDCIYVHEILYPELVAKVNNVRKQLEQEYFDPKSFDSTMMIKDYERVTCGEEYADVVLKRLREALK